MKNQTKIFLAVCLLLHLCITFILGVIIIFLRIIPIDINTLYKNKLQKLKIEQKINLNLILQ